MIALNSMVVELVRESAPPIRASHEWAFANPREGWIFIRVTAKVKGKDQVRIRVDSGPWIVTHKGTTADDLESMLYVSEGKHTLKVQCEGKASLGTVVVRAIPELIYCQYPGDPHVSKYGRYDWEFLQKYVLPNTNCIVASSDIPDKYEAQIELWKRGGGRWVFAASVVGDAKSPTPVADQAYDYWHEHPGFQHPLIDGIIVDEFVFGDNDPRYDAWSTAIDRIYLDDKCAKKVFYAWTAGPPLYEGKRHKAFVETLMKHGGKVAIELYVPEAPTEAQADKSSDWIQSEVAAWTKAFPDAKRHLIATLGYMSQPTESLNIDPTVDFKVFLDRQMHSLANAPVRGATAPLPKAGAVAPPVRGATAPLPKAGAVAPPGMSGLYGLMYYLSPYTDEETVRWAGRLMRHYCIEGKKTLLSDEMGFKYHLDHITNPDFDDALNGWSVSPAEDGGIRAGHLDGWSWLEGRYPRTTRGDNFLLMKRSAGKPNVISQKIRNLKPGRLYSLKMFTGDYQDIANQRSVRPETHAVSIRIGKADLLTGQCFDQVMNNCYAHHLGKFNDVYKAFMVYHWRVFRAKAATADLTISDWSDDKEPGGPVGQELMYNFIEVQPYLGG